MIAIPLVSATILLFAAPHTAILKAPHNVWDVAAEDLNLDGFSDVLALVCDEKSYPLVKAVCVYLATPEGGYSADPSLVLPLDPEIGSLFLAEVDGKPPRELVATHATGATVFSFSDNAFSVESTPDFISLLPSGSKEPSFAKDAAKDLNGDGIEEWLIPTATGFDVRRAEGLVASVKCDVVSTIRRNGSTYISHRLPAYHTFDLADSPTKGIAFLSDEFADFAYGPEWNEHKRFKIPVNLEEKWEATAKMKDVDGDGFPDLMVTQTRGTVNLEAQTQIYMATAPFTYPKKPTNTIVAKGAISAPVFTDVNGDKLEDVVVIRIPFGVKNVVNFFVRSKVSVEVAVYLFNGKDFGSAPAFETSLTMDAPEGREQIAYTMGDFNGDGRIDLAFGRANNTFVIHLGEQGRFLSYRPVHSLSLPSFGIAGKFRLNANDNDDILLYHPGTDHSKRIEVILF